MPRSTPARRTLHSTAILVACAALALTACREAPAPDAREPAEPGVTPAAPTPADPAPPSTQPLVLAVHPTRGAPSVDRRTAEDLVAGRVRRWVRVDGRDRPLRFHRVETARRARTLLARDTGAVVGVPLRRLGPWARAIRVAGIDPVRRPKHYPLRTDGRVSGPVVTVRVVGDVMLGRRVGDRARTAGDPIAPLRPMAGFLRGADLTVATLESTLSDDGPPQQGGDSFAAPPEVLAGLHRVGVDALSLANNHTGDYGEGALLATLDAVAESPVRGFGAGRDLAEASRGTVLRRHGLRVALLGFNAIGETPLATPSAPGALSVRMPPRTGPLVASDLDHVARRVRALAADADVVVVLPHWGTQYTHEAEPVQSHVARRLVRAGADLVVGGHPHWVQGLELHRGAVIAHSLGNYVFDMDFMEQTQEGVGLTATFHGDRLVDVRLTPYRIGPDFAPRRLAGAAAEAVLDDVWRHSTGPFARP